MKNFNFIEFSYNFGKNRISRINEEIAFIDNLQNARDPVFSFVYIILIYQHDKVLTVIISI